MLLNLKVKTTLIAAVLTATFLFSFTCYGNGVEFEMEMESYDGIYEDYNYGYSQGIWHLACVKTSKPYYSVEWYIDGVHQKSSYGDSDNNEVEAYFWPYWLNGTLKGTKYTIKAIAYSMDANAVMVTDSYTLTVYQPKIREGYKKTDVLGYAELTRQYYKHPYISIDCYVSAYNHGISELDRYRFYRFRHQVTGPNVNKLVWDEPEGLSKIKKDERYGPYTSANSIKDFSISIDEGIQEREYTSIAYVKLEVRGDVWVRNPGRLLLHKQYTIDNWDAGNTETFTRE